MKRQDLRPSNAKWRGSDYNRAYNSRPKLQLLKHWKWIAAILIVVVLLDMTAPQHNFEVCQDSTSNLCKD